MAVYAMNPDERRRKNRVLSNTGQRQMPGQHAQAGGYGTGFVPPERRQVQYGPTQPTTQPNFSHQQLAGNYAVNIPVDTRHQTRMFQGQVVGGGAPQQTNRYGQQQGFGEGYRQPRRSLGDQHRTALQRTAASAGRGYNPRTSAQMYGGRPTGGGRPRMTQAQALTRPAAGSTSYVGRPYGGRTAVTRRGWR